MALADLTAQAAAITKTYIAGDLDRPTYHQRLADVHAEISRTVNAGPCTCLACREHRSTTEGDQA